MNILSLCDFTGNMVRPWIDAGHTATIVDIQHPRGREHDATGRLTRVGCGVEAFTARPGEYDMVFAFPPCTHLAGSGARWWASKGPAVLASALALVNACLRIIKEVGTDRWMVENPVGRLSTHWRAPDYKFDPCDYGDPYTKRTCLWTGPGFIMPAKNRVEPTEGSKMWKMPDSKGRANRRSATPMGFANAVFLANGGRS